jgi:energy-coupling factor transport system ATP-binding protein
MTAVSAEHVSYRFPGAGTDVLRDLCWQVADSSVTLVVGPSGSGKTTLLRCVNGLVPHFHGGRFGGVVRVGEADTRDHGPRELAATVGMVFQDPEAQLVTDRVEDEIVFGLENLGVERRAMRVRLEETLDLLGIAHLRGREVATLSGGERQRVAIAATLAARPTVLVLDEPTSQLDPLAAHDVLAAIEQLNRDLGLTIVIAEHRLDRVLPLAERIVAMQPGSMAEGPVQEILATLDDVPPLIQLGRQLGWRPLPLTVRDARRKLDDRPSSRVERGPTFCHPEPQRRISPRSTVANWGRSIAAAQNDRMVGDVLLRVDSLSFNYDRNPALRDVSFSGHAGEVIALIGRNGSGKTTLLKQLNGLLRPARGRVLLAGADITRQPVHAIGRTIGYVPQHPTAILHQETLRAELQLTGRAQGVPLDPVPLLDLLGIGDLIERHPLDLSGGERQRAALAAIAVTRPLVLLLDEPTRGLPARDKATLGRFMRAYADEGRLVIVATHDVELVAEVADRVLMLADGEPVQAGRPHEVLAGSLAFSTQLNRLLGGQILTLDEARATLQRSPDAD